MELKISQVHWITSDQMLFTSSKKYKLNFNKKFPLLINFYHFNTAHPVSPNYHDFYEISYFYSGKGTYYLADRKFDVIPGRIVLIQPGQMHNAEFEINSEVRTSSIYFLKELIVHPASLGFEKDFLIPFSHKGLQTVSFYSETDLDFSLGEKIIQMNEELEQKRNYYEISLKNQLCNLLLLFLNQLNLKDQAKLPGSPMIKINRIKEVFEYIHNNYRNEIHLEHLAERANMSPSYFCRYFKKISGISPNNYILRYRIDQSKTLLVNTDLSIAEIAYEIGFNSQSYFDKIFQRYTSLSPSLFRQTYVSE